jgi:hypothetical protein
MAKDERIQALFPEASATSGGDGAEGVLAAIDDEEERDASSSSGWGSASAHGSDRDEDDDDALEVELADLSMGLSAPGGLGLHDDEDDAPLRGGEATGAEALRQRGRPAEQHMGTGRPDRGASGSSHAQRRTAQKSSSRARITALEDKFGAAALRSAQLEGQLAAQLERTAMLEERTVKLESQLTVQLERNVTLEETMTSRLAVLESMFSGGGRGPDPSAPAALLLQQVAGDDAAAAAGADVDADTSAAC